MIEVPPYSDLGLGSISQTTRWTWDQQIQRCETYRYYFDGDVFKERVPREGSNDNSEAPLLQPVGLNLVKMLCIAQADAIFGEWDEQPINFSTREDQEATAADKDAMKLASTILRHSQGASMLWEHELDRNVYGGGAFKINVALQGPYIKWTRIPRGNFFPIWDPDDPTNLLEAYVIVAMSSEQARAKYGYEADSAIVRRMEHWTKHYYENYLDGMLLEKYTGDNPWGMIPYVYTPRLRFSDWFGDSLAADIMLVQDELNMRIADIGEAINYNSHPTRWGINLPREFNSQNFPLGANSLWNLGRDLGDHRPEVGVIEVANAVQPGVLAHVEFLYDWSRTSVFAPPIAFGEDNGGGQRSGATLEIRMWPLIKAVRRSRSYLSASIEQALKISAVILKEKQFPGTPARALDSIMEGRIVPQFHSILPRDQAVLVDEVVKLLGTKPPSISIETAQAILGRGHGEVDRIKNDQQDRELWAREDAANQQKADQAAAALEQKASLAQQSMDAKMSQQPKEAPSVDKAANGK